MENKRVFGRKIIVAALSKSVDSEFYELNNPDLKIYKFDNQIKFDKYITSDFIHELVVKCNADWLDDHEEQTLYPDTLPTAIEIVSKAIKNKKNADFKDYLEQTKELMEIALANGTFMEFRF